MPQRPQDASCAICMDSLFNAKDDLNELMPITAPDCGHVFHEACISNWFDTQAAQYVSRMRALDVRIDGALPTKDDAPAECPSCRAEVYADPETRKPLLHRLFINFGDACSQAASQAMSSPVARKDEANLLLLRRARNVEGAVRGTTADSSAEDIGSVLGLAQGLGSAMESEAAKSKLVKKYLGGLIVAINKLRENIETHPLVPELQERITTLEEANEHQITLLDNMERVRLPAAAKKAADKATADERKKAAVEIARIKRERDLVEGALSEERTQRKAFRREMAQREAQLESELEATRTALRREEAERVAAEAQVAERTRLIKVHQARADKRKVLQVQIEQLQAENARLRNESAAASTSASQSAAAAPADDLEIDLDEPLFDDFAPEAPFSGSPTRSRPDNSLVIDLPPLDPSFEAGPSVVRSTTARTFTFDVDEGRVKKRDREEKSREKSKGKGRASDDNSTAVDETRTDTTRSKYFPTRRAFSDVLVEASSPPASAPGSPSPSKRPRPSERPSELIPPSSPPERQFQVLVPSSPTRARPPRMSPRPAAGPSNANRPEPSNARRPHIKQIPPGGTPYRPRPSPEVIDLVSSSPPTSAQRPGRVPWDRTGLPRTDRSAPGAGSLSTRALPRSAPLFPTTAANRSRSLDSRSLVDFLGVADGKGRIKKGVASGSKQRRKA